MSGPSSRLAPGPVVVGAAAPAEAAARPRPARGTAPLVELARRFLSEGATAEPWNDIWAALRYPDGRVVVVLDATLEQARETPRRGRGATQRRALQTGEV